MAKKLSILLDFLRVLCVSPTVILVYTKMFPLIIDLLFFTKQIFITCYAGANEHGSNKSGTIEMYAPSSYNETMTGETLSSVSEKSETYSDSRQDYVSNIFFILVKGTCY